MRTLEIESRVCRRVDALDADRLVLGGGDADGPAIVRQFLDLRNGDAQLSVLEPLDAGSAGGCGEFEAGHACHDQATDAREEVAAVGMRSHGWSLLNAASQRKASEKANGDRGEPVAVWGIRKRSIAGAELLFGDTRERLLDVLAAASPGELLAHGAHCRAAHLGLLLSCWWKHTPGGMRGQTD